MRQVIDQQVREMFREKAGGFSMAPEMPPGLTRRARRKVAGRLTGGAAVVAAGVLVWTLGLGTANRPEGGDGRVATVSLVAYVNADEPSEDPEGAGGAEDQAGLRDFAECMRDAGFAVPDPVRTERGWTIPVTQRPDDTPEWREAAFVTCRPGNVHLTGDLILGGRTEAEIQAFAACMRREGYDLGAPAVNGDEYRFDLGGTGFDTDSDAFHRAVFVTCDPST